MNTKKIIADSFERLLETKSFNSITVSEIMEECSMSRSNFYKHFNDKYDLMVWIYIHEVKKRFSEEKDLDWKKETRICYEFMTEKKNFFSKISKYQHQNNFLQFIFSYSYDELKKLLCEKLGKSELDFETDSVLKMFCASFVYLIGAWLAGGLKESPETMTRIVESSVPVSLSKYL